jgi:Bardet-Biedl syndrome 4 protein
MYHLHFIKHEFDQCEKQIDRLGYESDYSKYLKGMIRLRKGDTQSALSIFSSLSSSSPDHTSFKAMTRCLVLLGHHQTVCDLVREKSMYASPSDSQVWSLIGTSFLHTGNLPLARDAFTRAMQSTNRPDPFLSLSKVHLKEGDQKSAILVLRKASEMVPDDNRINLLFGTLLISSGMVSKGNEKLLQLQHYSSVTQSNLPFSLAVGGVLQARGDYDSALFRYKLANAFESSSLWNNIALCFSSRNRKVGAISCLQRAIYLNPLDWRISFNLAILLMQLNQFASAFHFFKASASFSGGAPHVLDMLSFCLERLQDDINANQAHASAIKAAIVVGFPNPILNYCVFLHNKDEEKNKDSILDLLMEFEKMWVKRKQSNGDFDIDVMRLASRLATEMNVAHHMAWIRSSESGLEGRRLEEGSSSNVNANVIVESSVAPSPPLVRVPQQSFPPSGDSVESNERDYSSVDGDDEY